MRHERGAAPGVGLTPRAGLSGVHATAADPLRLRPRPPPARTPGTHTLDTHRQRARPVPRVLALSSAVGLRATGNPSPSVSAAADTRTTSPGHDHVLTPFSRAHFFITRARYSTCGLRVDLSIARTSRSTSLRSRRAMICWKTPTHAPRLPSQYSGLGSRRSSCQAREGRSLREWRRERCNSALARGEAGRGLRGRGARVGAATRDTARCVGEGWPFASVGVGGRWKGPRRGISSPCRTPWRSR